MIRFYAWRPMRRWALLLMGLASLLAAFAAPAQAQSFELNGVAFDESAYLEPSALQAAVAPYVGRPIEFEDLTAMVASVQGLYSAAGIVTAQVVLPPQTLTDGILQISLIEASIDRVDVDGLARTDPDFLRRTITLSPGVRPDYEQIERDLRIYQLSHDIAPKIGFKPGRTAGTTTAIISGEEPDALSVTASIDNFGRKETGRIRATVFGRWASVTGVRDTLSFRLQAADRSKSVTAGYSRPVGTRGARLVGSLSYSDASVTTNPLTGITVLSDTTSGSVGYRRPFAVTAGTAWTFEIGIVSENSQSRVGAVQFSDVKLNEVYGTLAYLSEDVGRRLAFDVGVRVGDASALGTALTEGSYRILSAGASYVQALSPSVAVDVAARAQLALSDALPVARLFSAGGIDTVRGYPINIQSGDSGASVRVQLAGLQPWQPGNGALQVSPFAFFDAAFIQPYRAPGLTLPRDDTLASVGTGLRIQYDGGLAGALIVGVPLSNTTSFKDEGDPTIYVGLDYTF